MKSLEEFVGPLFGAMLLLPVGVFTMAGACESAGDGLSSPVARI